MNKIAREPGLTREGIGSLPKAERTLFRIDNSHLSKEYGSILCGRLWLDRDASRLHGVGASEDGELGGFEWSAQLTSEEMTAIKSQMDKADEAYGEDSQWREFRRCIDMGTELLITKLRDQEGFKSIEWKWQGEGLKEGEDMAMRVAELVEEWSERKKWPYDRVPIKEVDALLQTVLETGRGKNISKDERRTLSRAVIEGMEQEGLEEGIGEWEKRRDQRSIQMRARLMRTVKGLSQQILMRHEEAYTMREVELRLIPTIEGLVLRYDREGGLSEQDIAGSMIEMLPQVEKASGDEARAQAVLVTRDLLELGRIKWAKKVIESTKEGSGSLPELREQLVMEAKEILAETSLRVVVDDKVELATLESWVNSVESAMARLGDPSNSKLSPELVGFIEEAWRESEGVKPEQGKETWRKLNEAMRVEATRLSAEQVLDNLAHNLRDGGVIDDLREIDVILPREKLWRVVRRGIGAILMQRANNKQDVASEKQYRDLLKGRRTPLQDEKESVLARWMQALGWGELDSDNLWQRMQELSLTKEMNPESRALSTEAIEVYLNFRSNNW